MSREQYTYQVHITRKIIKKYYKYQTFFSLKNNGFHQSGLIELT